jgi:hypothetical protein
MHDYPHGRKGEYEALLAELASLLSKFVGKQIAWTAVRQQVRWAISHTDKIKDISCLANYAANKTAAIEAGFVKASSMAPVVEALVSE